MECICLPCDLKNLHNDESVIITFELSDGSLIQASQMFAREAERLLLKWLTD